MNYDNWKLDNNESNTFYCERCDRELDTDCYVELNECCQECDDKLQEL
jgi:hypothetical protein